MILVQATKENASPIVEWFTGNTPGNEFITFYKDTNKWLELINNNPNRKGYVALVDNKLIGFLDIEIQQKHIAWISFAISPEYRSKGYGTTMIKKGLEILKEFGVEQVKAGLEKENTVSQKLLTKLGFKITGQKDGVINYLKII